METRRQDCARAGGTAVSNGQLPVALLSLPAVSPIQAVRNKFRADSTARKLQSLSTGDKGLAVDNGRSEIDRAVTALT